MERSVYDRLAKKQTSAATRELEVTAHQLVKHCPAPSDSSRSADDWNCVLMEDYKVQARARETRPGHRVFDARATCQESTMRIQPIDLRSCTIPDDRGNAIEINDIELVHLLQNISLVQLLKPWYSRARDLDHSGIAGQKRRIDGYIDMI